MLRVTALSRHDVFVDDATTRGAMTHRCLRASMIHVVAGDAPLALFPHCRCPFPRLRLRFSLRALGFRFTPALAHPIPKARARFGAPVTRLTFPRRRQATQRSA